MLPAPITERAPIVTPLVTTTFAPSQTLSPSRVGPLLSKPCQVIGLRRVVEAVVGVGDEAAVGGHAVVADLDEAGRGDHHALVEEDAARRSGSGPRRRAVSQTPRSSSVPSPISRRPSRSSSSTSPLTGHLANARRRASSRCSASRFQGSAPRWYQRHLSHHRRRSDSRRGLAHGAQRIPACAGGGRPGGRADRTIRCTRAISCIREHGACDQPARPVDRRHDALPPAPRVLDARGRPSRRARARPSPAPAPAHVVAPGETLSGIAAANGLTTEALAAANGLSPTSFAIAGTTLTDPGHPDRRDRAGRSRRPAPAAGGHLRDAGRDALRASPPPTACRERARRGQRPVARGPFVDRRHEPDDPGARDARPDAAPAATAPRPRRARRRATSSPPATRSAASPPRNGVSHSRAGGRERPRRRAAA